MKRIELTDDHWADYLSWDYCDELVKGLKIGDGGMDLESGVVGLLREWVAKKSTPTRHYTMTKHDAAVVLNMAVKWPDNLITKSVESRSRR